MLSYLNVNGLAIIEELSIEFEDGFNVITGETGAGKSILILALGLLLGKKTNADTVRKGHDKASVSGEFVLPSQHKAIRKLEDNGIGFEEGENGQASFIIRRSLSKTGRSGAWINDTPVTITFLKSLAASLLDIFGQHDSHRLLDSKKHTEYLDEFLDDKEILAEVGALYTACKEEIKELQNLVDSFIERARSRDYLEFRYNELKDFAPSLEDYQETKSICSSSANSLELKQTLQQIESVIESGSRNNEPLSKPAWEILGLLENMGSTSTSLSTLQEEIKDIAARLDDLSYAIGKEVSKVDVDEGSIEQSEERLATYQSLFRKLGCQSIEELISEQEKLAEEIGFIGTAAAQVRQHLENLDKLSKDLERLSKVLSSEREEALKVIQKRVETEFKDLGMKGARFSAEWHPNSESNIAIDIDAVDSNQKDKWETINNRQAMITKYGAEKALFTLSANPGEPFLPVHKIASGGEVSRIMLALKKALSAGANTCILVFDEIDTGISGRIADMVGQKMRELSKNFQVVCISHLPQVAAYAEHHYKVQKSKKSGQRTTSEIVSLGDKEKVEELAIMLSGDKVSKSSLENAETLRNRAHQFLDSMST